MDETSNLGMLKFKVGPDCAENYLWRIVERIQQAPGVLRVRAECSSNEIEIIFRYPTPDILGSLRATLRTTSAEMMTAK